MMIKMMDELLFDDMVKQFADIDKDQTYMLNTSELKKAFQTFKISMQDDQIQDIINEIDYSGNGKINFTEFLVATMDVKKQLTNELLIALFSQFDCDGSGSITELNVIRAMSKIGKEIT